MKPTIYRIEFPDGQFYIGSTVNFSRRRRNHLESSRRRDAVNRKLQAEFDSHPVCAIYQIASGFDRETLHLLEQQIIDQECPPLNIQKAQPIRPRPLDQEVGELQKIANRCGVKKTTLYARLRRGIPLDIATTIPLRTQIKPRSTMRETNITVDGVTHRLMKWAEITGIKPASIHSRRRLGWTPRQIVGYDPRPVDTKKERTAKKIRDQKLKTCKLVDIDGVLATPRQHALARGYTDSQLGRVYYQMKKGLPLAEILEPTRANALSELDSMLI